MYAQPFGPAALPLSRVSTRRPPFSFWLLLMLTVARPLEHLISALGENHTVIWRRGFQSISLVLLAVIAGLSGLPVSANAAQQVCVVPERDIAAQRSCITLQELPRWLRKSIRRDAGLPAEDDEQALIDLGIQEKSTTLEPFSSDAVATAYEGHYRQTVARVRGV